MFDLVSIAGAAVIGVAFTLGRFGEAVFLAPCALVIATALGIAVAWDAPLAQGVLLVGGLSLLTFGLMIVRIMLHRSVSLRMLEAYRDGAVDTAGGENIRGRIADVERYGLAKAHNGIYELTAFGRAIAGVVATLYRVTNVEA